MREPLSSAVGHCRITFIACALVAHQWTTMARSVLILLSSFPSAMNKSSLSTVTATVDQIDRRSVKVELYMYLSDQYNSTPTDWQQVMPLERNTLFISHTSTHFLSLLSRSVQQQLWTDLQVGFSFIFCQAKHTCRFPQRMSCLSTTEQRSIPSHR